MFSIAQSRHDCVVGLSCRGENCTPVDRRGDEPLSYFECRVQKSPFACSGAVACEVDVGAFECCA